MTLLSETEMVKEEQKLLSKSKAPHSRSVTLTTLFAAVT